MDVMIISVSYSLQRLFGSPPGFESSHFWLLFVPPLIPI